VFDTELISIKGVDPNKQPEPAKEEAEPVEEKVSRRQSGFDHVILGFVGLLIFVSGTIFCMRARNMRRNNLGDGEGYKMVERVA